MTVTWFNTAVDSLAEYPPWLVIACASIVSAALLYLTAKIVKWVLYLLAGLVLLGGGAMILALWW